MGIAGGDDVFPERSLCALGRDRILGDAAEVVRRAPDIMFGSWCGKRFRPQLVAGRAGWEAMPAVRDGELHEIKSPIILQPGPAALTDGIDAIHRVGAAMVGGAGRAAARVMANPSALPVDAPVASPCIDVCWLDAQGLCIGCRRTIGEIHRVVAGGRCAAPRDPGADPAADGPGSLSERGAFSIRS